MKIKSIAAAAALALASASSFASSFSFDSNAAMLDYTFSVSGPSDVLAVLTSSVLGGTYGYDILGATFDGVAFGDFTTAVPGVSNEFFVYSASGISAGSHTISVWGTNLGSTYHANVTLTPVPEPETYALLLAGLGVLGFVASRRRNG